MKKFTKDIQENKSSFNEENFKRFIKNFEEFLDNNKEQFNKNTLLSLPMIDYSNALADQEPLHLIKHIQQHLIKQSNDRKFTDPNRIYLRSLIDRKKVLPAKINEVEKLPYMQNSHGVQLLAETIKNTEAQEDTRNKVMSILLSPIQACCKVDKKDKNTAVTAVKNSDSILDNFLF
ncbi:MAG: hypothetical protein NMK33_00385 [Candidatus Cardinium sp.]|uniref:hypothetical protein n=1 Tax=Cardinium endosymbiont of Dermatophagoides farinae TaxID=2597823 RepID=UPI0011821A87|nr:hypothetical protein [Cardinium endosymbiont of Dermatophagoides farinae]TSJ80989.1 hypothetical protein FPG78_03065 [Cardinium endosymbiont of Dermatophagoides farinae]UWW97015.1 MAG: hypothetical protein NMK33_00385 [Candidatus Cardinium sp.]